ncbi:MAG: preprotein translocase subunit YajC [Clostridia bacterium]|nr:preprotein translocase subunit YajC [Clostridia bacterium]
MFDLVASAESTAEASTSSGSGIGMTVVYIVVMIAIFYFLLIRPQKKREKQTRSMLDDLRAGDEVITIGGVMGIVVSIKDESVLIASGANNTKLRFEKSAIKEVLTVHDEEAPEIEDAEEESAEEKPDKKSKK